MMSTARGLERLPVVRLGTEDGHFHGISLEHSSIGIRPITAEPIRRGAESGTPRAGQGLRTRHGGPPRRCSGPPQLANASVNDLLLESLEHSLAWGRADRLVGTTLDQRGGSVEGHRRYCGNQPGWCPRCRCAATVIDLDSCLNFPLPNISSLPTPRYQARSNVTREASLPPGWLRFDPLPWEEGSMSYPIRTIVAGIATVDETDPALYSALHVAEHTGTMLHLIHAFEFPVMAWEAYARMGMMPGSALDQYTQDLETRLELQAKEISPSARVRVEAIVGPPAPLILGAAAREQADLVVVGATRRGTFARAILGTTAQRVIRESRVPVLVVRNRAPQKISRVLLTTDLSEFSGDIHELGIDLVESLFGEDSPELRSLHVVWRPEEPPFFPVHREYLDDVASRSLEAFIAQRRTRGRPVDPIVRHGDPANEITAEVADWRADLLVVGTHGRMGATRWLLGSVAESAIRGAETNVLVIPTKLEPQSRRPNAAQGSAGAAAPTG
ncbi:MAG: hypothetical protein GEU90_12765 [Gemmatimonas sp.]|nr:hypothetical protein [Gemmatimonas sp.]